MYPYYNQYNTPYQQPYTNEKIWVQGEDAAKAYLVAPNGTVTLWDSQRQVFYEKKADSSGRPFLESFEYTKKEENKPENGVIEDKCKNELIDKIEALESRIIALEKGGKRNAKQSNSDDTTV